MPGLLLGQPGAEGLAGQGCGVEGPLLHQLTPLRRLPHLDQQRLVEGHLLRLHPGRHEDAAQHQVFDVEAGLPGGRDIGPARGLGHLLGPGQALAVEDAKRPQCTGPPMRHRLDRVVHRRVDVLADKLHRDLAAAAEGHVGQVGPGRLGDGDADDLVLLLGAGAAQLQPLRLGRGDEFLPAFSRAIRHSPRARIHRAPAWRRASGPAS